MKQLKAENTAENQSDQKNVVFILRSTQNLQVMGNKK